MRHKIEIKYAIWHRSFWTVEAPDEATAEEMALEAVANSEETPDCHRTHPDIDGALGVSDEEIVKITSEGARGTYDVVERVTAPPQTHTRSEKRRREFPIIDRR